MEIAPLELQQSSMGIMAARQSPLEMLTDLPSCENVTCTGPTGWIGSNTLFAHEARK